MTRRNKNKMGIYSDRYWSTAAYNQQLFNSFRDDITALALSRFKWINLPDTCDQRYLELQLLYNGCATIAHPIDKPDTHLSLAAVIQNTPNMYDNPKCWRARGESGKTNFAVSNLNGVFIYENITRFPLILKINIWARELTDIKRVEQINRFHQRIPFIIKGPRDKKFDMENLLKQITMGEFAILACDGISDIDFDILSTGGSSGGVKFLGDELYTQYKNTLDMIYSKLGIASMPYKSERMIADEVKNLEQSTELIGMSPLECRRKAAKKYNDRFGTNIKVVWNSDIETDNFNITHDIEKIVDAKGEI